jgi:hypothetical protein
MMYSDDMTTLSIASKALYFLMAAAGTFLLTYVTKTHKVLSICRFHAVADPLVKRLFATNGGCSR